MFKFPRPPLYVHFNDDACCEFHASPFNFSERTCGKRADTRIIDGVVAEDGEFPWMVKLKIAFDIFDPNTYYPNGTTKIIIQ